MNETTRCEHTFVKQVFGDGARIREVGPTSQHSGIVSIVVDGQERGRGVNFQQALHQATRDQEQER